MAKHDAYSRKIHARNTTTEISRLSIKLISLFEIGCLIIKKMNTTKEDILKNSTIALQIPY